jgi:hypothetical protein
MRLTADAVRTDGVTLVHLHLRNDELGPRRVRVADRLGGPVWFPRRRGVPEAGWDEGGFEGVLAAGATRALGYATPAEPADPPATVAWTERAAGAETKAGETTDPAAVVRRFGDPRPPRDALAEDG